ncbi:hypothetical protein FSARC_1181 [Fusarium sarcochroum]|uniref:NodB homology domain-containing protein n=1 Tax=Fusarium sarcochroum TaxID=1208366 RepID=A0A8H4XFH0_9HYPO|nr:hypothetical protein FSARC_1181 [Fusarium sarcochroum]
MQGLIVLASLAHVAAGLSIPTSLDKRQVSAGIAIYSCTQEGTVALTFDDGPFAYTESVLDQLATAGFKATFFLNGMNLGNIADYQSTVSRMVDEGHQVASHTYGHPNLAGLDDFEVEQQMSLLSNEFSNILGKYPVYMRPPYFSFSDRTLQVLGKLGYKVIIADIDTNDWLHPSIGDVGPSLESYKAGLENGGSIVLMHDVHINTVENILPQIIQATRRSGRKAVTVGECLGDPETNWYRNAGSQTTERNTTDSQIIPGVQTPGPIETPRNLRPLAPANERPGGRPEVRAPVASQRINKRRTVLVACDTCSKRKAKCDGARPCCSSCLRRKQECVYATEPYETRVSALKRIQSNSEQELQDLQASHDALSKVFRALASSHDAGAAAILKEVRGGSNPAAILNELNQGTSSSSQSPFDAESRGATHNQISQSPEFDPQERPATRLPSLSTWLQQGIQSQTPYQELFHLLQTMNEDESIDVLRRVRAGEDVASLVRLIRDGNLTMQMALVPETQRQYQFPYLSQIPQYLSDMRNPYLEALSTGSNSPAFRSSKAGVMVDHRPCTIPYPASVITDPHLWNLKASKWTNVIQNDQFLSKLLNSYFMHQYPIFLGFHKDCFLQDMASGRQDRFCSPLLVNTILAAGCHTYMSLQERAQFWNPNNLTYRFLAEAKRLWELQCGQSSLTSIQAAIVLNTISDSDTMENIGKSYMLQAVAMAHDIDLFKVDPRIKSRKMQRARAFTAWCLYTWDAMQSFYFRQEPLIKTPPETPLPDIKADPSWYGEIWVRYPLSDTPVPTHFGHVARATLDIRSLMHEIASKLFKGKGLDENPSPEAVDGFRSELDYWFSQLPEVLSSKNLVLPMHLRIHMEYYSTLIALIQFQGNPPASPSGTIDRVTVIRAHHNIETLVRLYHQRHNYQAYDSFLVLALLLVGNRTIDSLESDPGPRDIEHYRATLVACANGLHDQGKHSYMPALVYHMLRNRMRPQDKDLVSTYVKDHESGDPNLIAQYNQSQYPVPIIKINEDPRTAHLAKLVKSYEELSLEKASISSHEGAAPEPGLGK